MALRCRPEMAASNSAIALTEARFRALVQHSSDLVAVIDPEALRNVILHRAELEARLRPARP